MAVAHDIWLTKNTIGVAFDDNAEPFGGVSKSLAEIERATASVSHEFGHIESLLKNLPEVVYYMWVQGNKNRGHEPGNPSGENSLKRQSEYLDNRGN